MKHRLITAAACAALIIGLAGPANAATRHRPTRHRTTHAARRRPAPRRVRLVPPASAAVTVPAINGVPCGDCATSADVVGWRITTGPASRNNGYCLRTAAAEAAPGVAAGKLRRDPACDPLGVVR